MKVYVKPTDYQADQVMMSMRAEGGTSLYGNEDIPNFSLLTSAITEAGVGDFSATALRKALAGKSIRLTPSISSEGQRITGSSSVKDMETMLQLAHLYFMAPRKDSVAFEGLKNRTLSFLKNRNASSKVVYNDSLSAVLYDHNLRMAPVTGEVLAKADYGRIMEIYRERFSDASNFKTVFIGKIDMAELRPLLCQYLATLPSTYKKEETDKKKRSADCYEERNGEVCSSAGNTACQRERVLYGQRTVLTKERSGAGCPDPRIADSLYRFCKRGEGRYLWSRSQFQP